MIEELPQAEGFDFSTLDSSRPETEAALSPALKRILAALRKLREERSGAR